MSEETIARLWALLKTRPFRTIQAPSERVHVHVYVQYGQVPKSWTHLEPT